MGDQNHNLLETFQLLNIKCVEYPIGSEEVHALFASVLAQIIEQFFVFWDLIPEFFDVIGWAFYTKKTDYVISFFGYDIDWDRWKRIIPLRMIKKSRHGCSGALLCPIFIKWPHIYQIGRICSIVQKIRISLAQKFAQRKEILFPYLQRQYSCNFNNIFLTNQLILHWLILQDHFPNVRGLRTDHFCMFA